MNDRRPHFALAVVMLFASLAVGQAADMLKWDAARDHVDAIIETWTVPQLLQTARIR